MFVQHRGTVTARSITSDPETGIPDLIHRLTDDSKRLVSDEVRLARLEAGDTIKRVTKGALWMSLAFGVSVIMMVSLTVFLVTFIGRFVNGHMWVGALVTGVLELALGAFLISTGFKAFAEPSYSLEASRASLADTKHWATSSARRQVHTF